MIVGMLTRGLRSCALAASICVSLGAAAQGAPKAAATIAPLHALVAQVMEGVGEPELILSSGASPHVLALRPSQARALASAEIVFWLGGELEPGIARAVSGADKARLVSLAEASGVVLLRTRDAGVGGDERHDHAGEGHAEHSEHIDPHLWLDPENAKVWLDEIALRLSEADPANAARYIANAAAAREALDKVRSEIDAQLTPARGKAFASQHDATQYFEHRFGLTSLGAISGAHGAGASARDVALMKAELLKHGGVCILTERSGEAPLARTLADALEIRAEPVDQLGAAFEPGPKLYEQTLRGIAGAILRCVGAE